PRDVATPGAAPCSSGWNRAGRWCAALNWVTAWARPRSPVAGRRTTTWTRCRCLLEPRPASAPRQRDAAVHDDGFSHHVVTGTRGQVDGGAGHVFVGADTSCRDPARDL